MQSFSDLFANNRLLAVGVVLAAIAVILAVGVALFRLVFGRRLHMSGGRTRQPRLGVVDAFDLDRQRQLVLIRRDNVEHLLMIGGPNDVLIEAAIVRAPVALSGRDKENGFSPSVGIPAPMPQQTSLPAAPLAAATAPAGGPEGGANMPIPAALPAEPRLGANTEPVRQAPAPAVEAQPVQAAAPAPAAQAEGRLPPANTLPPAAPRQPAAGPRPISTLPPRPPVTPVARPATGPTPRANLSRATPVAPPPSPVTGTEARQAGRVEPVMSRGTGDASAAPGERPLPEFSREPTAPGRLPPNPMRRPEPQPSPATAGDDNRPIAPASEQAVPEDAPVPTPVVPRPATPQRPTTSLPSRTTLPPRPPAASSTPPAAANPAPPNRAPIPSMSSLEEEMAKLLGRPMPPSDSSNG